MKQIIKFIIVGCCNTLIGVLIIFIMYNVFELGYWLSSSLGYILGSIFSYYANKYFTFNYKKKDNKTIFKFCINIAVCYFVAYSIAKPLVLSILKRMDLTFTKSNTEQIALLCGMCIYVILNFFGQKYICFNKSKE